MGFRKTGLLLKILTLIVLINIACQNNPPNANLDLLSQKEEIKKPNVLIIMIDDLNDCIASFNGHKQSYSPNIDKLAQSGILFTNAHTNAPMCGPSRASLFSGIYPHNSRNFYQANWVNNEVLSNSKMMMEQFKDNGYNVLGTGKILHHNSKDLWTQFGNEADYTPTPFDGEVRWPHPDVPAPFSDIGWVDGSLGPFKNLEGYKSPSGKPLHWTTGNPKTGYKEMRYISDSDRDLTPDEVNANWAAEKIKTLSTDTKQPFFLAVGFLRPHTPLVAPQKYFDKFPLDEIEVTLVNESDADDTYLKVAYKDGDVHALRFGEEMFDAISKSYGSTELGLKKWTQAYLACVAAVDDNVKVVMDALDNSPLRDNTIVVLASDHGFHMGEKDYLYKNSLWDESTRIPLIMRVPGLAKPNTKTSTTTSLIDIYPTLLDLCDLPKETLKNSKGHALDGQSLKTLLENPEGESIHNKTPALTAVYAGSKYESDPAQQHYSVRTDQYRYILYNTGHEELYDHKNDPNEWNNLAYGNENSIELKTELGNELKKLVAPHQLIGFSKLID